MNIPKIVSTWVEDQGQGQLTSMKSVGGGCINNGARLFTSTDQTYFLKQNRSAPEDMFLREAEGLEALNVEGAPRVPQPLLHGKTFLLLEDLNPGRSKVDYWPTFGRKLADLHNHTHSNFGFDHNNYIGSTPQMNPWTADGYEFFSNHRLIFQADLAEQRGYLEMHDRERIEKLIKQLPELIPQQPASLLHGDLWSGNAIADSDGSPAMIDPAVHYGWAEAELGMTTLFGRFPQEFYNGYMEERPLTDGWRERLPIYNLYHLLNHVNLFGLGYLGQTRTILRRFT